MKQRLVGILAAFSLLSCGTASTNIAQLQTDYVIAFGSCNREDAKQPLWDEILKNKPDVFLWGGDNVYADTDSEAQLAAAYQLQENNAGYNKLTSQVPVYGIWDDHDYGKNDAGSEWEMKKISQHHFLDFMKVPAASPRREREGVYNAETFETSKGSIKVLMLDTRYFRDELIKSSQPGKRYEPSAGTILGEEQWRWLEEELENSNASFTVILSSIQVLPDEHGFETWGNFPLEVNRLKELIISSSARNVILLSGDRHISEFSVEKLKGLDKPLVEFTSSGLTHAYKAFNGEPNEHRVGKVVSKKSFGLLKFDFENSKVLMEMRGVGNRKQQDYIVEFQ